MVSAERQTPNRAAAGPPRRPSGYQARIRYAQGRYLLEGLEAAGLPQQPSLPGFVLTEDHEQQRSVLEAHYQVGGWPALYDIYAALRPRLAVALGQEAQSVSDLAEARVRDVWGSEMRALDTRTECWLQRIEDEARILVLRRIALSEAQIRVEAERYLLGVSDAAFDGDTLRLPRPGLFATSAAEAAVREQLRKLRPAEQAVEKAAEEAAVAQRLAYATDEGVPPVLPFPPPDNPQWKAARIAYARTVLAAGQDSPVLYWVRGLSPDAHGRTIAERLRRELETAWNAGRRVSLRMEESPARARSPLVGGALAGHPAEQRLGQWFGDPERNGPWRYPLIIEEARGGVLGWVEPALQCRAVKEAYRYSGRHELTKALLIGAGMLVLSGILVFAGAGAVATGLDVVISASGLADEIIEHERADDDYRAVLDRTRLLTIPPRAWGVVGQTLGLVASTVPGAGGLLLGAAGAAAGLAGGLVPGDADPVAAGTAEAAADPGATGAPNGP
ncbi:hypothetical protein ACIPX0_50090 [Streptomyces sp. NPDC090075]|uniref:hypothetical protein n=1 Tax=unclassified Streptomyces TaxID=2593676 RepID=UPI0038105D77